MFFIYQASILIKRTILQSSASVLSTVFNKSLKPWWHWQIISTIAGQNNLGKNKGYFLFQEVPPDPWDRSRLEKKYIDLQYLKTHRTWLNVMFSKLGWKQKQTRWKIEERRSVSPTWAGGRAGQMLQRRNEASNVLLRLPPGPD